MQWWFTDFPGTLPVYENRLRTNHVVAVATAYWSIKARRRRGLLAFKPNWRFIKVFVDERQEGPLIKGEHDERICRGRGDDSVNSFIFGTREDPVNRIILSAATPDSPQVFGWPPSPGIFSSLHIYTVVCENRARWTPLGTDGFFAAVLVIKRRRKTSVIR